jgi:MFS family permease
MALAQAAGAQAAVEREAFRIPPIIRKNTVLLALAQAFSGAGMGLVYSMGPLMILAVSGSTALTGITVTLMGLSRFVVSYPVGRMTDALGRKPAMLFGLVVGLIGAIFVGASTLAGIFPLLIAAVFVFGMGMNTAQQLRVAAADMYPPSRRAEGLGYVLTGSLVGVGIGPSLVAAAQHFGPMLHVEPLGLPWLMVPILIVPSVYLVTRVQPDPKVIAEKLSDYYPGYVPEYRDQTPAARVTLGMFMGNHARRVAVITNMAAQANMAVVMVNSSLLLHHYGASLWFIAVSSALHSVGMWAFSIPLGRLSDRLGRKPALLFGGVMSTVGALLVTSATEFWPITLGAFLVGLGWSGTGIATLAVIADTTRPGERGRCVGLNESMAASVNVAVPLLAGPVAAAFGVATTGLMAAAVMVPALGMLVLVRQALVQAATPAALEQPVLVE